MRKFLLISFLTIGLLFVFCEQSDALNRPRAVGLNWNPACAAESAVQFAICRQSGGSWFSCSVGAGLRYWQCSGSTFQTAYGRTPRLRAAVVGRRAIRRGR